MNVFQSPDSLPALGGIQKWAIEYFGRETLGMKYWLMVFNAPKASVMRKQSGCRLLPPQGRGENKKATLTLGDKVHLSIKKVKLCYQMHLQLFNCLNFSNFKCKKKWTSAEIKCTSVPTDRPLSREPPTSSFFMEILCRKLTDFLFSSTS